MLSLLRAMLHAPPAVTLDQFVSVPTCAGAVRCTSEPSPSWPLEFTPHVHSVPSVRSAAEKDEPGASLLHVVAAPITVGVLRVVVVASPSWPLAFVPHA